jgi:hypothetical protein
MNAHVQITVVRRIMGPGPADMLSDDGNENPNRTSLKLTYESIRRSDHLRLHWPDTGHSLLRLELCRV